MGKKSLADIMNAMDFNVTFVQGGIKKHIYSSTKTDLVTISIRDLTLSYDSKRFFEDPSSYVAEQLSVHKDYHKLIREEVSTAYQELNTLFEEDMDLEKSIQFVPENMVRPLLEVTKLVLAPLAWTRFRTFKGLMKKSVLRGYRDVLNNQITEAFLNYGKISVNFFQLDDQIPSDVKIKLVEWEEVQKDLLYFNSRLIDTTQKKVRVLEERCKLFFPNLKYPLYENKA